MSENIYFLRSSDTHRGSFSDIQRCDFPLAIDFDYALEGKGKSQVRLGHLWHESLRIYRLRQPRPYTYDVRQKMAGEHCQEEAR